MVQLVLGVALLYGLLWLLGYFVIGPAVGFDRELSRAYRAVNLLQTRIEVVGSMGKAVEENIEFHLGQYNGYEKEYRKAEEGAAAYFLYWSNGLDGVYAVGFDQNDRVVYKDSGGT